MTISLTPDADVTPFFAAADASPLEILVTYPDGSAAVALRQAHGGHSLFVGAPGLTSELLRLAARKAGVHLYTQTDCNVYANGPIVALHASQDGPITLDTGRRGQVRDAITGDLLGSGPCVALPMKKGETRVFASSLR
jgi:beta-galactosidase